MYLNNHTSVHVGLKIVRVLGTDKVCSPYYQFLLVKKGSIVLNSGDGPEHTLHKGDIICIAPDCCFYSRPLSANILIGLRLDPPFVNALIPPGHELRCNSITDPQTDYTWLERLLTDIGSAYYSGNNDNRMLALLYELSDCLTERHIHPATADYNAPDYVIQERISTIRSYIETNYHQAVSLSALAELMYLTPQYVSRFIKKHMHTSFGRYLTHVRLEHACSELIHTDHSVTNIAMNTGFPNVSAFHKAFRETYGETPGSWRSSHRHPEEASPNVQVYTADDVLPSVQQLHLEPAAAPVIATTDPIRDMINIGPLELAMEPAFHNAFMQCRKDTPFRYVRCYNAFSEKIIRYDERTAEYNFTTFFEIIDFFYQHDTSLCFELSYKPPKDPDILPISWENTAAYSDEKDQDYYVKTLNELLLRSVSRYDAAYVSSWRFEIWCKTGEKLTLAETPADYIARYEQYYQLIKQHLPACAVGGPGFNMSGSQELFAAYIKAFHRHGLRFDFISLYGYIYKIADTAEATSPLGGAILSPNPDHIADTLHKYKRILKQSGYGDTPVFLTEFGSVINVHCYITDSLYQADFLIHNILALYKETDCIAQMGLTDPMPWPLPYTDLYYPATALFTSHGIPKPSFAAGQFLFRLGDEVLSHGDQHIMTCTSPGHYQLLLYHYVHFDESYCFHPMELVLFTDTYEVLARSDAMEISFILNMLPDGQYKCRKYTLNRQHGSLLDLLITTLKEHPGDPDEYLRAFNQLSPEELTYYIQAAVPRQAVYYEQVQQGLQIETTLAPCEIQFYEFHLQL